MPIFIFCPDTTWTGTQIHLANSIAHDGALCIRRPGARPPAGPPGLYAPLRLSSSFMARASSSR